MCYRISASTTRVALTLWVLAANSAMAQTMLEPGEYEEAETSMTENEALGDLHADTRGQGQTMCLTPDMVSTPDTLLESLRSDMDSDNCRVTSAKQDGDTTTLTNECMVYGQPMQGKYTYIVESSTRYTVSAHMEGGPQPVTMTSTWERIGDCND